MGVAGKPHLPVFKQGLYLANSSATHVAAVALMPCPLIGKALQSHRQPVGQARHRKEATKGLGRPALVLALVGSAALLMLWLLLHPRMRHRQHGGRSRRAAAGPVNVTQWDLQVGASHTYLVAVHNCFGRIPHCHVQGGAFLPATVNVVGFWQECGSKICVAWLGHCPGWLSELRGRPQVSKTVVSERAGRTYQAQRECSRCSAKHSPMPLCALPPTVCHCRMAVQGVVCFNTLPHAEVAGLANK